MGTNFALSRMINTFSPGWAGRARGAVFFKDRPLLPEVPAPGIPGRQNGSFRSSPAVTSFPAGISPGEGERHEAETLRGKQHFAYTLDPAGGSARQRACRHSSPVSETVLHPYEMVFKEVKNESHHTLYGSTLERVRNFALSRKGLDNQSKFTSFQPQEQHAMKKSIAARSAIEEGAGTFSRGVHPRLCPQDIFPQSQLHYFTLCQECGCRCTTREKVCWRCLARGNRQVCMSAGVTIRRGGFYFRGYEDKIELSRCLTEPMLADNSPFEEVLILRRPPQFHTFREFLSLVKA